MRLLTIFAFFCLGLALAGCSTDTQLRPHCVSDEQCVAEADGNPNWACDRKVGDCVCTGDAACGGELEHCELRPSGDGRCHPNVTCEWNRDCEGRAFCDLQDRFCRATGCSDDLQCDLGEVCDPISRTCIDGCRSHGDCELRDTCLCQDGDGNPAPCVCDETDRSQCQVGLCVTGTCADKSFCRYGELCVDGPPGELSTCVVDERGPYCGTCSLQAGGQYNYCGSTGPNYCLFDKSDPAGQSSFCGVDCRGGEECPNGMSCRDVLVLTDAICRSDNACQPKPNAPTCTEDSECQGGRCVSGRCAGRCAVSEGAQSGWCSCVQHSDCPEQACVQGRCEITREPCVAGENDSCRGAIMCVQQRPGEVGYCHIGRNCAPDEGVTCTDVRCDLNPESCR